MRDAPKPRRRRAGRGRAAGRADAARQSPQGTLVDAVLERPLRPGEVSLDELERAFRETATEVAGRAAPAAAEPAAAPEAAAPAAKEAKAKPARKAVAAEADVQEADKIANQSIRVNVDTLEHLMTMVSELVLTRNQLLEISRRNEDTEFKVPLQRLSNVTAELQEGVMKTRMQPIGNAWQKLPRIVRDLSRRTRQADRTGDARRRHRARPPGARPDQGSADPHGAQLRRPRPGDAGRAARPPASPSRAPSGCPPITRAATSSSASPTTAAGSTPSGSRPRRSPNGLVSEAELEKMTEAQIHKFIFAPGFSTAATVTSVSGRGVGMDVVRTNIDQIGGTIDVKSVAGEGSSVTIKIPLTLAIVSALIVEAAGDRFAIPQLSVVELVRARANSEHRIERIKDTAVLRLRNKLLPLMHLKKLLEDRRRLLDRSGERLHRGDAGRQPDLRHRGRRRVPHRGNRGQADVDQAAAHRHVLRQHHPGRRRRDHDHRPQRHRQGARRRRLGRATRSPTRTPRRAAIVGRAADLAAGVPRRLEPAQGGAARRSSPGWRRSPPTRSSSPTAATWCSTASS